jgi:hypothetical protein
MSNFKISGTTNEDVRIKINYENLYLGYKDITAGNYQVVFADQRPAIDPDDSFDGTNGDPPDSEKWTILEGAPEQQSGNLECVHPSGSQSVHQIRSNYLIGGNFNIETRWDLTGVTNTDGWYLDFKVLDSSNNGYMTRQLYGRRSRVYSITSGVASQISDMYHGSSIIQGGYRILRSGSEFSYYYWHESFPAFIGPSSQYNGTTDNIRVYLRSYNIGTYPAVTQKIHYINMNSGTIISSVDQLVDISAKSNSTGQILSYGDVLSIETEDAVDIT